MLQYFTVSNSRLSQPRGSAPHTYVPQELSGPVIPPCHWVASYVSQDYDGGIRTRLHTGLHFSESELLYDWRFTALFLWYSLYNLGPNRMENNASNNCFVVVWRAHGLLPSDRSLVDGAVMSQYTLSLYLTCKHVKLSPVVNWAWCTQTDMVDTLSRYRNMTLMAQVNFSTNTFPDSTAESPGCCPHILSFAALSPNQLQLVCRRLRVWRRIYTLVLIHSGHVFRTKLFL
jgi:hypothetical protein